MALDILLDTTTHDLVRKNGDLVLIDGGRRVEQQVKITLLTFYGEWFLDTSFGVPYLEKIHVKSPNRVEIEFILRAKILDVPDVTKITYLDMGFDRQARKLKVECTFESTFGTHSIEV